MNWEFEYYKLQKWILDNFGDCKHLESNDRSPDCISCQAMALFDAPVVKPTELDPT